MPVRFADPKLRGNVIRYLQSLGDHHGAAAPATSPDPKG
jgi:hypothetical protein